MRRFRVAARLALVTLLVVGLQVGGSQALAYHPPVWRSYHWPVKPFASQHPVQAVLGDPRTVYPLQPFGRSGPNRAGTHSFHNGIDIVASPGTPVYPVVSGRVAHVKPNEIIIDTADGRSFQYWHLSWSKAAKTGKYVVAEHTELGWIRVRYSHLHLTEIDGSKVHNPLDPGHLTPYHDRMKPVIVGLYINNGGGPRPLVAAHLGARDTLVVAATDPSSRSGLPQVPALIEWRLIHGSTFPAWKTAADFRHTAPPPRGFWDTYTAGTYQNNPVFERRLFSATPGRYLFRLGLDARHLAPGSHRIQVRVTDISQNRCTASWPLRIDS
jgi:hypothetical protein